MNNEIIFYTTPDGNKKIGVVLQDETAWLTQKALAELFGVQRPAITKHLKKIFETGELVENSVSSILEHTAAKACSFIRSTRRKIRTSCRFWAVKQMPIFNT